MASHAVTDVGPDGDYPEDYGDGPDGEFDPEINTDFGVDPAFTTTKHPKEQADAAAKKEAKKKADNDGVQNLKSVLVISGAAVAVIGAIFAIVNKMKEA